MATLTRHSADTPTAFSSPGFRALYTLTTWGAIGFTLSEGSGMFVGLIVLSIGLMADYLKFTSASRLRKWCLKIGFFIAFLLFLTCLFALAGSANIVKADNSSIKAEQGAPYYFVVSDTAPVARGLVFDCYVFWWITGICVFWTLVDYFTEKRDLEKFLTGDPATVDRVMGPVNHVAATTSQE